MLIHTKEFKDACSKILVAASKSEIDDLVGSLELNVSEPNKLTLSVTDREYYVSTTLDVECTDNVYATVNASTFLKLVSQITSADITLDIKDTQLVIKANGTYKIPLIFEGDHIMHLPPIVIENVTSSFNISGSILTSILNYNSKDVTKQSNAPEAMKKYYVDQNGCITFSSGACVNNFTLEKPVKLSLTDKVVKLFKLFNSEDEVEFKLGFDPISDTIIQTKVSFASGNIKVAAILPEDKETSGTPAEMIRAAANYNFPNMVVLSKDALLQALNRLAVLSDSKDTYGVFDFKESLTISDLNRVNSEDLVYENGSSMLASYKMILNLKNLKNSLANYAESYITLMFGNGQSLVVKRGNIYNVISETKMNLGVQA